MWTCIRYARTMRHAPYLSLTPGILLDAPKSQRRSAGRPKAVTRRAFVPQLNLCMALGVCVRGRRAAVGGRVTDNALRTKCMKLHSPKCNGRWHLRAVEASGQPPQSTGCASKTHAPNRPQPPKLPPQLHTDRMHRNPPCSPKMRVCVCWMPSCWKPRAEYSSYRIFSRPF